VLVLRSREPGIQKADFVDFLACRIALFPRMCAMEFGHNVHAGIGELPVREQDVPAVAELPVRSEEGKGLQLVWDMMKILPILSRPFPSRPFPSITGTGTSPLRSRGQGRGQRGGQLRGRPGGQFSLSPGALLALFFPLPSPLFDKGSLQLVPVRERQFRRGNKPTDILQGSEECLRITDPAPVAGDVGCACIDQSAILVELQCPPHDEEDMSPCRDGGHVQAFGELVNAPLPRQFRFHEELQTGIPFIFSAELAACPQGGGIRSSNGALSAWSRKVGSGVRASGWP
jgi:hypothetical protein